MLTIPQSEGQSRVYVFCLVNRDISSVLWCVPVCGLGANQSDNIYQVIVARKNTSNFVCTQCELIHHHERNQNCRVPLKVMIFTKGIDAYRLVQANRNTKLANLRRYYQESFYLFCRRTNSKVRSCCDFWVISTDTLAADIVRTSSVSTEIRRSPT